MPKFPERALGVEFLFCSAATVADLRASGTNIKWYTSPSGGFSLSPTTVLQNEMHYYAGQQVNNCESETRLAVLAKVNIATAPTGSDSQFFCKGATVANLEAIGTEIRWYTVMTGGISVDLSRVIADGTYYYASQTINGCESSQRLKVEVTIYNTPAPTWDAIKQTFCDAAVITEIQANGIEIKYYTEPQGGNPLPAEQQISNDTFYYLTQTLYGCESENRLMVKTLVNTSLTPEANVLQQLCNTAYVNQLSSTGVDVKWYNSAEGGNPLDNNTLLSNNGHYYASQTINGCESVVRKKVTVQIVSPDNPSGNAIQQLCQGATLESIEISGFDIQWYENKESETPLSASTILQDAKTYFASQSISGCESKVWSKITVTIIETPAPTGKALQNMDIGETLSDLLVYGFGIEWYSTIEDAAKSINVLDPYTPLEDQVTYYCTQKLEGCRGIEALAVTVSLLSELITSVADDRQKSGIIVDTKGDLLFITSQNSRVIEIHDILGRTLPFQRNENYVLLHKPEGVFCIRYESEGRLFMKKMLFK